MPKILVRCFHEIKLPENVSCSLKRRKVWIRGPRGTLFNDFKSAELKIWKRKEEGVVIITVEKNFDKKKRCAVVKTIAGHIKNMIVGVTKGFRYKMKLVYAHFPINATVLEDGKMLQVFHYIGCKEKRRIQYVPESRSWSLQAQKTSFGSNGNDIARVS